MDPQFIGPTYQLESRPASVQRTVNLVPVPQEPGNERTGWVFKDVPGLVEFAVANPPDPLFAQVLLLVQGGTKDDKSSYAHTMTNENGAGITENTVLADVPGGYGVRINAAHNVDGIRITEETNEFDLGLTQARCYEGFIQIQTGVIGLGSQIVFNDGFAFNGNLVYVAYDPSVPYEEGSISIRLSGGSEIAAPAGVAKIQELETWYFAVQIYEDNSIKFWTGKPTDLVATGEVSLSTVTRPVDAVDQGPYIGYVGGSGGENDFILGPYRITAGERYTDDTITIPTELFPEL